MGLPIGLGVSRVRQEGRKTKEMATQTGSKKKKKVQLKKKIFTRLTRK